ncbi:MAG: hypothetical protein IV100_25750 [Myxococcales bacterium]|nr:hypothetical protein [Myxococcales bacterium]
MIERTRLQLAAGLLAAASFLSSCKSESADKPAPQAAATKPAEPAPKGEPAPEKAPKAPEAEAPKAPEAEAPKAPEAEAPKAPEAEAPKAPEAEAPKPPEAEAPKPPEAEIAKAPEAEAPKAPEAEIAKAPEAEAPKAPEGAAPVAEAAAPEAPAVPTASAGPAYFAVDKRGIVRMDETGFKVIPGSPDNLLKGMQLGPDGALYVIGFETVYRLEGEKMKAVAKGGYKSLGSSPDQLAIAPNGHIWVGTFKGVALWDGNEWQKEDKTTLPGFDGMMEAFVVDKAGRPWLGASKSLLVKDGAAWRAVDLSKSKARMLWVKDVQLSPEGVVHVLFGDALFALGDGDTFTKVKVNARDYPQLSKVRFASNGDIGIVDYEHVHHVTGGKTKSYSADKGEDFNADRITAAVPDASGRLWVGSAVGVTVFGPGDAKTDWPSGSVPELIGSVVDIVVAGAGPAKLAEGGPIAKGGLTGKLLKDGEAMAGVEVELCTNPSSYFKKTPCHDAPVKFAVTTDAGGVWTVNDMPLGNYGIAVKDTDGWRVTLMNDLGDGMKEGKVYDTGSLKLDSK